jgi:hypothetical protein
MSKPRFQVGDRVRWAYWGPLETPGCAAAEGTLDCCRVSGHVGEHITSDDFLPWESTPSRELVGSRHFTGTVVRAGTFEGGATDGAYGYVVKVDGEKADDGRDVGVFLKESDLHPLERDADADRA